MRVRALVARLWQLKNISDFKNFIGFENFRNQNLFQHILSNFNFRILDNLDLLLSGRFTMINKSIGFKSLLKLCTNTMAGSLESAY